MRRIDLNSYATVGTVSNTLHKLTIMGKAGVNRNRGRRPKVRGKWGPNLVQRTASCVPMQPHASCCPMQPHATPCITLPHAASYCPIRFTPIRPHASSFDATVPIQPHATPCSPMHPSCCPPGSWCGHEPSGPSPRRQDPWWQTLVYPLGRVL